MHGVFRYEKLNYSHRILNIEKIKFKKIYIGYIFFFFFWIYFIFLVREEKVVRAPTRTVSIIFFCLNWFRKAMCNYIVYSRLLYRLQAFNLPMRLSTSQVPTSLGHLGLDLIPESILGGFGPACEDGYGVLYCSIGDNMCKYSSKQRHNPLNTSYS